MAAKKKCFVISPIGDDGTDVRKEADALLWVAKSALEKFDFEVIRVDQIARVTTITNEIILLIQESELCLIILTGENPNVFYEAGRRHETGKPFIQLIRKGERLPFDVASIRTIIYDDIQNLSSAAKVVADIQRFVSEFEASGYGTSGTGVSLSTIAGALDRIERKVGQIIGGATASFSTSGSQLDGMGFIKNPRESYLEAVAQGNLDKAIAILPHLEKRLGMSTELLASAGVLSAAGYEPAFEIVYRIMTENFETIHANGTDGLQVGISAMVQFYVATDREKEGVERCEKIIRQAVSLPDLDNKTKAHMLNQLQMLHWGAEQSQEALQVCEQVIEYDSSEPAYVLNLSLIYEKLGLLQKALEMVDKYMQMGELAPAHLSHAVEIYVQANRLADAKSAFNKLRQVDMGKASILLLQDKIKKALA